MAAQDIYYGLELFTNSLDYGIEAFQKEIAEKNSTGDFSRLSEIAEYAQTIKDLKAMMDKHLTDIAMLNTIEETDMESISEEEEEDEKALPNYDRDRFYVSHMKKVVDWYNELVHYASLDFVTDEEREAELNAAAEEEA